MDTNAVAMMDETRFMLLGYHARLRAAAPALDRLIEPTEMVATSRAGYLQRLADRLEEVSVAPRAPFWPAGTAALLAFAHLGG